MSQSILESRYHFPTGNCSLGTASGDRNEVFNDFQANLGEDGFGMELDAEDRPRTMAKPHDQSRTVLCRDLKFRRESILIDCK